MSVARVTEIISSSKKSFEDAIEKGINRAAKTLIRCKRLRRTPLRARARGRPAISTC
jgi:flavin-binding protein dodecin